MKQAIQQPALCPIFPENHQRNPFEGFFQRLGEFGFGHKLRAVIGNKSRHALASSTLLERWRVDTTMHILCLRCSCELVDEAAREPGAPKIKLFWPVADYQKLSKQSLVDHQS